MCWSHTIRSCRKHGSLVPRNLWPTIVDTYIHTLHLSFSDDVFNRGVKFLLQKWNANPLVKDFPECFVDQWIEKLPYW